MRTFAVTDQYRAFLMFNVCTVHSPAIFCQSGWSVKMKSPLCKNALVLFQEGRGCNGIGKDEVRDNPNGHGLRRSVYLPLFFPKRTHKQAFNNEDPTPYIQISSFPNFCKSSCKETPEGTTKRCAGVEQAESQSHFTSGVHP